MIWSRGNRIAAGKHENLGAVKKVKRKKEKEAKLHDARSTTP